MFLRLRHLAASPSKWATAQMRDLIAPPFDYLIFALICAVTLTAISFWLRRTKRNSQTLIITWIALPIFLVSGWFLVGTAGQRERDRVRKRIAGMAPTYAQELSLLGHEQITLDTDPNDPLYLKMIDKQIRWLSANQAIADIYTFRKHPDGNQLIVDSETDYDHNGVYEGEKESRTVIGEIWKEENKAIDNAFLGIADFDDEIYTDRWGTWVSAYVPILDQNGEVDAVLGVDFPAPDWHDMISRARLFAIGFLSVVFTIGLASAAVIAVLRANLAERERAARDLLAAKNAAEAATKSKSEFLANMSHEIRTPMNGIIGMTDLLAGTELKGQQQEYLRIVKQSANSLLGLLNDILDFSKIEAGKLELESIRFDLRDSIERTLQTLAFRAAEKGLEILCRIDPELPNSLIGDPGRLSQVLVNLAGNAIKFTQHGEVVINIQQQSRSDKDVTLLCSVRDTGIGIAADKLQSIFAAFSQEDTSTTRRFGGTGLGLAICSQLVKLMGGRIWAESEKGAGATFYFTSSFLLATDAAPKLPKLESLAGIRVLVIDDNKTNRFILDEILKTWKMQPVLAESGPDGLIELNRAVTEGHPYRLALIDCMMPEMDGFELARIVLNQPSLRDCRVVMISSAAAMDDHHKCRELGIARYMTKPIIQSELLETILELSDESLLSRDSSMPADDQPPITAPLRILLAEDGVVNQQVATELLKKHQHQVVVAENGREAAEAFTREPFDLVLMDVQMPEMDGLEATKAIRRYENSPHEGNGRHTPIIAMTASAMKGDREKCLCAGMDAYLSKPIDSKELYELIARYAPAEPIRQPQAGPRSNIGNPEKHQVLTMIDLDAALENSPGGYLGLQEMAPLLQQECERMMSSIREGLDSADSDQVRRSPHNQRIGCRFRCAAHRRRSIRVGKDGRGKSAARSRTHPRETSGPDGTTEGRTRVDRIQSSLGRRPE